MGTSIIIKTFERPGCLKRLLDSIPSGHWVYVADDSRSPPLPAPHYPHLHLTYLTMPFDSGISAGRNLLVQKVRADTFVLCDDDFVFDERTDLEYAERELYRRDLDILGGAVFNRSSVGNMLRNAIRPSPERALFDLRFYEEQGTQNLNFVGGAADTNTSIWLHVPTQRQLDCDVVCNFFIARTDSIKRIGGWHEELKVQEHRPFFLRAKQQGLRVGFDSSWGVQHRPGRSAFYNNFRFRDVSAAKRAVYSGLLH